MREVGYRLFEELPLRLAEDLPLEFAELRDQLVPFFAALQRLSDIGELVDLEEFSHLLFARVMNRDLSIQMLMLEFEIGKSLVSFLSLRVCLLGFFVPSD